MSNEFLNGLQAASNAVAGNVAGPVDILSFLLRKAGMPVPENPIGGSNWMTQKGLMAPVRQGASQVIGETAGLLGPAMVSQFGPQIARGLLKGGENLASPRTLNPQRGVVAMPDGARRMEIAQRNAAKPVSEGGLGLGPNNTAQERAKAMGFDTPSVHWSRHGVDVSELDSGKFAIAPFDAVGTHTGTPEAAMTHFANWRSPERPGGVTYPVVINNKRPWLDQSGKPWKEEELSLKLRELGGHDTERKTYRELNGPLREKIFKDYTTIPYVNDVEAAGSVSYITPPQNIRSRFAAFDPARRNEADLLGGADPYLLTLLGLGAGGAAYYGGDR